MLRPINSFPGGNSACTDYPLARKRYGQVFFASLPPARRVIGPGREVFAELEAFFGRQGAR